MSTHLRLIHAAFIPSSSRDHDTVEEMTMVTTRPAPAAPPSRLPQDDLKTVVESRTREWHFHIYFLLQSPAEKAAALALRDAVLRLRRDGGSFPEQPHLSSCYVSSLVLILP
jgi:hypothetical protein